MIESERKRLRLIEMIERWCNHTKVSQYLRTYDISSLVGSIIDEFYSTHLCCGHQVNGLDEGVVLEWEEWVCDRGDMEGGGGMATMGGVYCEGCAKWYKKYAKAREISIGEEQNVETG